MIFGGYVYTSLVQKDLYFAEFKIVSIQGYAVVRTTSRYEFIDYTTVNGAPQYNFRSIVKVFFQTHCKQNNGTELYLFLKNFHTLVSRTTIFACAFNEI